MSEERGMLARSPWKLTALVLLTLCLTPGVSFARKNERLERMPEKYRKWLEQEVPYIISDRERDAFLNLQSVAEWEAFIQAFWRRRDPDPLTPVNELKVEHYRRIDYANKNLGRESAVPGWMTDRGKMYIILGEPDDRETFRAVPFLYPAEVWFYQENKEKNLPPLYLLFFQDNNAGPYRLFNHLLDQPEDLMPSQPLHTDNSRAEAYELLQQISPDLAQASVTMRADEGPFANINQPERAGLDFQMLLSDIEQSPFRRVDTSYVEAAKEARGLVESDYLFNYVPNNAVAHVLPGPTGVSFVHYSIEIEPQHMTMAKDEDRNAYYTRFELRGEVTTKNGEKTVVQFVKEPYMKLTESQFKEVNYRPFCYRDMFPVASGEFTLRVVLKNKARSEYTIFETPLEVPEPSGAPFIAAPVLLYDASELTQPEAKGVYRTYQLGALKLNPNAKRVYAVGEALRAYVPMTDAMDEDQLRLRIISREDTASEPIAEKTEPLGAYGGRPVVENVPLVDMSPGRYRLVAELVRPTGEVLTTSSTDFDVTPRTRILRPWTLRESIKGEDKALVLTALAEQYMKLGDMAKGRHMYREALKDNPNLITPRIALARFHLDEGQAVEAIKLLEPAYAQDKDNAEVILTLGDAHFQAKNYKRAAQLYEASVILRPPSTALFNALGVSHAHLGNTEKALHYFERSLDLDPHQDSVKALVEKLKKPSPPAPLKK